MWDSWRAYGGGDSAFLTDESHLSSNPEENRDVAISFAAYRLVSHRYALSVNAASTQLHLDARMAALGFDMPFVDQRFPVSHSAAGTVGGACGDQEV